MSEEFPTVEVELSDADKDLLAGVFVITNLRPASQFHYQELVNGGESVKDALFTAIINDVVLAALETEVERVKEKQDEVPSDGC